MKLLVVGADFEGNCDYCQPAVRDWFAAVAHLRDAYDAGINDTGIPDPGKAEIGREDKNNHAQAAGAPSWDGVGGFSPYLLLAVAGLPFIGDMTRQSRDQSRADSPGLTTLPSDSDVHGNRLTEETAPGGERSVVYFYFVAATRGAELLQKCDHRTPVCEGALKQVQPHKGGQQKPARVYVVTQRYAGHHKGSGNHAEITIHGHVCCILLRFIKKYTTGTVMRDSASEAISPAISAMARP